MLIFEFNSIVGLSRFPVSIIPRFIKSAVLLDADDDSSSTPPLYCLQMTDYHRI